jgi:transposase
MGFSRLLKFDSRLLNREVVLDRMVLRDEQWERVAPLLPGKVGDPGQSAADNRLFLEAVLWIVRVGAPWRDLPESFGQWKSVFKRFRRWTRRGVFEQIFAALSEDADFASLPSGSST